VPDLKREPFSYAIVRVVPRIERGEQINAGVILYCRTRDYLAGLVALDDSRLRALDADVSPHAVREHLETIVRVAKGDPAADPIASMSASERFGWLVAPSSTVIQTSEVHTGLTADPRLTLETLFTELVTPVGRA
jgi:hypothetical protein